MNLTTIISSIIADVLFTFFWAIRDYQIMIKPVNKKTNKYYYDDKSSKIDTFYWFIQRWFIRTVQFTLVILLFIVSVIVILKLLALIFAH